MKTKEIAERVSMDCSELINRGFGMADAASKADTIVLNCQKKEDRIKELQAQLDNEGPVDRAQPPSE